MDAAEPPAAAFAPALPMRCRCGQPVFFANTHCLACDAPLGYDPRRARLLSLRADARHAGLWRGDASGAPAARYRRCANLDTPARCNWLIEVGLREVAQPLCRACRLNRTIPDLSQEPHPLWWGRIEAAKRRLVAELLGLGLPVRSRVTEDPQAGLAFDLLRSPPGGPAVLTGHADGIITLNVEEADDARREAVRSAMREPYRTLLGHLRHEVGHYYWQRLIEGTPWHEPFRAVFGDERADYAAALARHHEQGAPADWRDRHVSAYASSHPWEDWAETWAHYLHLVDTLATARHLGVDPQRLRLGFTPFTPDVLYRPPRGLARADTAFLAEVNHWVELAGVLNELSRSMGQHDLYPFVLPGPAVTRLHFIHQRVRAAAREPVRPAGAPAGAAPPVPAAGHGVQAG